MKIRSAGKSDRPALIQLVAEFRHTLAELRGKVRDLDLQSAGKELTTYQEKGYPIYAAEGDAGKLVGYLVCRVDEEVVWAESLYVFPVHRRQGVGSALYEQAERLAEGLGGETLYNWVDPNNDRIIAFLQKRGYHVLNLIEVRKARTGEVLPREIQVGSNSFNCP